MNVNDPKVLEMINIFIASGRLNRSQILHVVNLASISKSISDLKDNIKWETFRQNVK